jgi:hypothetical protein
MLANKVQFDINGLSLFVAMPTNRDIDPRTVCALLSTQATLMRHGVRVLFGVLCGNSRVEEARTKVAWDFLASDCNRCLWIDSDQLFTPKDVLRLLCFSTKLDIVGAVYPLKKEPIEFAFAAATVPAETWGLIKVNGMGLGFCMTTREVMQKVADQAPLVKFDGVPERKPMIFRPRIDDGANVGEDIGFFRDCRALGYDVWVDPAMPIGHIGAKVYTGTIAELALEMQEKVA